MLPVFGCASEKAFAGLSHASVLRFAPKFGINPTGERRSTLRSEDVVKSNHPAHSYRPSLLIYIVPKNRYSCQAICYTIYTYFLTGETRMPKKRQCLVDGGYIMLDFIRKEVLHNFIILSMSDEENRIVKSKLLKLLSQVRMNPEGYAEIR